MKTEICLPFLTHAILHTQQTVNLSLKPSWSININTPGTAGGPDGRDRTLAVKSGKNCSLATHISAY